MKLLVTVLIMLILLAIKPAEAIIIWTQNQESVVSGSQYMTNANYNFQINWIADDLHTVSDVLFESNFNGVLTNYTVSTNPSVQNSSNAFFINFTGLSGGNYVYRWYASDNESNWNSTDQINYVINPNSSVKFSLFLNGIEGNRSYNLNDVANFTVSLALPNRNVYLNSNYPGFDQQTNSSLIRNTTNLNSSGLFSLTAYWNGDVNYSASSKTYYFDTIPLRYSNLTEYPVSPTDYYSNRAYTFGITWSGATINQVIFESNHTGAFKNYTVSTNPSVQNSSNNFYIILFDLPAETFAYRWIVKNNINGFSNNSQRFFYILKRSPLTLETMSYRNILNQTKSVVICRSLTNEVTVSNFKLYRDSTLIENDTTFSRRDEQTLSEGSYVYKCNNTQTQNFTNQTVISIVNTTIEISNIDLVVPSSIQANLGENVESNFFLENNLGYSVNNLSLVLTGIPKNWYTINELPTSIPNNFSLLMKIKFNIPNDTEKKDYNLTLTSNSKTPSGETKTLTKTVILTVTTPPPKQNYPPVYSQGSINTTVYNESCLFTLKWNDDNNLSGYIFSSNVTGEWVNSSWTPFSGTEAYSYYYENLNLTPKSVIAWKFYANDSNDLWTSSEEYYLQVTGKESQNDLTIPILIVSVFVVFLAIILIVIGKIRSKSKKLKKENVVYVYNKESL